MKWFAALIVSVAVLASLAVVFASGPGAPADLSASWTATESLGPDRTRAASLFLPWPTCKVMLYGGAGPNGVATGETFLYAPQTDEWLQLPLQKGTTRPPAASQAGLTWDADQKLAVLFGGFGSTALSRASVFNPSTLKWSGIDDRRCSASTCPGARWGHAQVWSQYLGATLVFGGTNSSSSASVVYDDLWALKASAAPKGGLTWKWSRLTPTADSVHGVPQARYMHGMVEIPEGPDEGKLLIYGGTFRTQSSSGGVLADTWLYDPAAGGSFEYVDAGIPTPRTAFGIGYSPSLHAIIINGGSVGSSLTGETWAFDLSTRKWVRVLTALGPPIRSSHDIASDSSRSCGDDNAYIVEAPVNVDGPDFTWFLRMP